MTWTAWLATHTSCHGPAGSVISRPVYGTVPFLTGTTHLPVRTGSGPASMRSPATGRGRRWTSVVFAVQRSQRRLATLARKSARSCPPRIPPRRTPMRMRRMTPPCPTGSEGQGPMTGRPVLSRRRSRPAGATAPTAAHRRTMLTSCKRTRRNCVTGDRVRSSHGIYVQPTDTTMVEGHHESENRRHLLH